MLTLYYAYFDGTGKAGRDRLPCYVGIGGSLQHISKFNAEWYALLNRYELHDGLTMKEALVVDQKTGRAKALSAKIPEQTVDDRIDALIPFAKCIRRNLTHAFGVAVDGAAFARLAPAAQRALGKHQDSLALGHAMLKAASYVDADARLAIICDDDENVALECYAVYRALLRQKPEFRRAVSSLSFADDRVFFQLQGADMLATLFRRHSEFEVYSRGYDYERLYRELIEDVNQAEQIIGFDMQLLDEERMRNLAGLPGTKYPAIDVPSIIDAT